MICNDQSPHPPHWIDRIDNGQEEQRWRCSGRAVCFHLDFTAFVDIARLFNPDDDEAMAEYMAPRSVSITVIAECTACGKRVRFEGPIGIGVGAGAAPTVSIDGTELRAAGHMGDNGTPPLRVSFNHGVH